jgi:hypothetical protein
MKYHVITILLITLVTTNKTVSMDNATQKYFKKRSTVNHTNQRRTVTNLQVSPPRHPDNSLLPQCPKAPCKKKPTHKRDYHLNGCKKQLFPPKAKL